MNVSSVKNLNGEVFSAVKDASLTNVVQTNSGNWQDITAYQSNSASYLTAHQDLSDYYTTADANTLSSMLSGAIDYVSANAGDEFPISADEAIQYVQTNSGTIDDTVTSYQTNSGTFLTAHQAISAEEWNSNYETVNTNSGVWGGEALPITGRDGIDLEIDNGTLYIGASAIDETVGCVQTNSGVWGGSALPVSAGKGVGIGVVNDTLVVSSTLTGYVWTSASLFTTATPTKNTSYTLSDNCSNYDKLEVDFYDINNWRTQMDCPIPPNLASSGTRGGYFNVVTENTSTTSHVWFKCFNWTAAQNNFTCYCSEMAAQGGSTTQSVNANQQDNPPKVIQIIGWKRVEV